MTVLIITHTKDEECTPLVVDAIKARGGSVLCLNTDRFPAEERLVLGNGLSQQRLINERGNHDLAGVTAIWVRRLRIGASLDTLLDPALLQPAKDESRRTLLGFLATTAAFVLDPVANVASAENKALQLAIARDLGLSIPDTLISNDGAAVARFASAHEGRLVVKMQSAFKVFRDGREHVVFSNTLEGDDFADLQGLELCPMIFQEKVPKCLELRVTVVGRQLYAASIDSAAYPAAREDWRRNGRALCSLWKAYQLPWATATRLLRLMDRLKLNYGAMDLILTPDNRHVFLEVNPVGEFFWLDRYAGFQIAAGMADLLLDPGQRRDTHLFRSPQSGNPGKSRR